MSELSRRGVTAVKWSAGSTAAVIALQMVAQVFLARRLGPEIYGVFGIGLTVFTFSNFLATFGFGWALLQLPDLQEDDVRFAFSWQLASGAAAGVGLYLLAPLLSNYFHDLRVQPVMRWLALACLLNSAASPASNLLLRDLNFRAIGLVNLAGYAIGYIGVGIPLAWAGAGVYSLIAAWLVQSCIQLAASFLLRPHSLRPLFWYDRASTAMGVGSTVFVTNLTNWFLNNVDRVLIGRLLNAQAVGLYNVSYNIANRPNSLLINALQPAFFSGTARMQDDQHRLGRAYLQVIATIWVLLAPVFVFLSFISTDLIRILYGPRWNQAGEVLGVLFLAMPIYITWAMSTPVLWNTGRRNYEALLQFPLLLLAVVAFYHFAPMGVRTAAWVTACLLASRGLVIGIVAFRAVELRFSDLLPHLLRSALLCIVVVAGAMFGRVAVPPMGGTFMLVMSLVSASISALLLIVGIVRTWPAVVGSQAAGMVLRFVPELRGFLSVPEAGPVAPNRHDSNE